MISTSDLASAMVEMADTLVGDFDLVDFLGGLTIRAATISGATAVGLMLSDPRGGAKFMAASNESGKMLELLQLQNSEGPCLDCIATGFPVINADLAHAEDQWPAFAPLARQAGFQSVHAVPLRLRDEVIGALNLFGGAETKFASEDVRAVQALADIATISVLQHRNIARAEEVAEQLQSALDSRILVEQAKGALAQADGITPAEAFDLLRSTARSSQRKLIDVAKTVLVDLENSIVQGRGEGLQG